MYISNDHQKKEATDWFTSLRDQICTTFEKLEADYEGPKKSTPPGKFNQKCWSIDGGGGGVMSIMGGRLFEKVGVKVSTVRGGLVYTYTAAADP